MATEFVKTNSLYPGQLVVIQNDTRKWVVIRCIGKFGTTKESVYELANSESDSLIQVLRRQIGVSVNGKYFFGPYNEIK